jgi:hypothetical protein
MRRIILLMTAAALVVVGALFAVSVAGRTNIQRPRHKNIQPGRS